MLVSTAIYYTFRRGVRSLEDQSGAVSIDTPVHNLIVFGEFFLVEFIPFSAHFKTFHTEYIHVLK